MFCQLQSKFSFSLGDCMDEMSEEDCAKVVKKDQCEKKGAKCMMSCDMCNYEAPAMTTTMAGGGRT